MTKTYKDKLAERKAALDKKNAARVAEIAIKKIESDKKFAIKKAEADLKAETKKTEAALKKIPAPFASKANDPQQSIKPEKFESTNKIVGENGFHVEKEDDEDEFCDDNFDDMNDSMGRFPQEMGFDLFGINVNTDALLNKAVTAGQTAVNNYLSPAAPVNAQPAQIAAPTTTVETNYITQALDPATMKMLITGGKIFGGLVASLLALKIVMAVTPSFSKK